MKHIFIGDVHGCIEELNALIDTLNLSLKDEIIFVGDLLDKGPDSAAVVRRVRELATTHNVVVVMGNHEDTHSRYRGHLVKNITTAKDMASRKPELPEITAELTEEDIAFLDTIPLFHHVPAHNILVVHGGIPRSKRSIPSSMKAVEQLNSKQRKSLKLILRTRYVDAKKGNFVSLGKEQYGDPYWADVYDGRFGHVIFGHQPFMEGVEYFDHATGIDTGAVFGGTLTALVIESDGSRSVVSVQSKAYKDPHDFMAE